MSKKSKRMNEARALIEPGQLYGPGEAIKILGQFPKAKFDETVEVHARLGVDPRQADQAIRGTISLPAGTGKEVRVAVFAEGEKAREAEEAGADIVGSDELVEMIQGGQLDFDATVATPDQMGKVGKLGKILGPRGLMPNPKLGTVTMDVGRVVGELKGGKVEYRNDRYGIVHVGIGKASFESKDLYDNFIALVEELVRVKPASSKGRYIRSLTLTTTMGPSIKVDPARTRDVFEDEDE
jgi:large subunit ribosomal protein L1